MCTAGLILTIGSSDRCEAVTEIDAGNRRNWEVLMQNTVDDVLTRLVDEADVVLPRLADARRVWLAAWWADELDAMKKAGRDV